MQRHLAAIMAVDVVGYSRLMATDESGTLDQMRTLRTEILSPLVTLHGGRIFKLTGDGALAPPTAIGDEAVSTVRAEWC